MRVMGFWALFPVGETGRTKAGCEVGVSLLLSMVLRGESHWDQEDVPQGTTESELAALCSAEGEFWPTS